MGVPSLIDLFDEKNHAQLPGGILESFGRLFKNELKLYVYPLQPSPDDELKTVDDIKVQPELQPLYDYLAGRGSFVNLDNYRPEYLPIFSRDVLRRIAADDESWESMCPSEVAELIKRRGFFGYVKPRDSAGRRVYRADPGPGAVREICLTWSAERRLLPAAELFRQHVIRQAAAGSIPPITR